MYKSISKNGESKVVKLGKSLPPLTDEDRKEILEMFLEHSSTFLMKEEGVWKSGSPDFLI